MTAGSRALSKEIKANHALLEQRHAVHQRFGFDARASVRFVLEKALPLRGRVLDVGTGKGRFVTPLARHVAHVTTVDVNAGEQRHARLEAIYAGVADRIRFLIQDARFLPWPAGHFDAVLCWNVFHHLDDPERVFAEMIRLVKPGGKLVLADFSSRGFRLMDAIHGAEGARHPHPPNRFANWRARLRAEGFRVRHFIGQDEELLVAQRRFEAVTTLAARWNSAPLAFGHLAVQSRRDCATKPRVARPRATLGRIANKPRKTPQGVSARNRQPPTGGRNRVAVDPGLGGWIQGSACRATLGFGAESLRDSPPPAGATSPPKRPALRSETIPKGSEQWPNSSGALGQRALPSSALCCLSHDFSVSHVLLL